MKRSLYVLFLLMAVSFGAVAGEPNALTRLSVACVRERPAHSAELGTQILMGHPVEILSENDGWCEVRTVDGYHGFVIGHSLVKLSPSGIDQWKRADRSVYTRLSQGTVWSDTLAAVVESDIVPGCILEVVKSDSVWSEVRLPDGRAGFVRGEDLQDIKQWAVQPYNPDLILKYAESCMGTPYLWGGTSSKAMDCSGLTWVAYFLNGRILPRNASAQGKVFESRISLSSIGTITSGALLFFGNPAGRINHVALYQADGDYIESSQLVRRNSLRKDSRFYKPSKFLYALNMEEFPSIWNSSIRQWLFE